MGVDTPEPRFALVTRPACHLCDLMEERLVDVLERRGLAWSRLDVDRDARLLELYGDTVPVLLLDGREVARVRISRRALARLADALEASPPRSPRSARSPGSGPGSS